MPRAFIPDHLLSVETISAKIDLMEDMLADQLCKPEAERNHKWIKDAKARIAELDATLKQRKP